jgi:Flp pilus assembly protein TadB
VTALAVGLTLVAALVAQSSPAARQRLGDRPPPTGASRTRKVEHGSWIERASVRFAVCVVAGAIACGSVLGVVGVFGGGLAGWAVSWQAGRMEQPGERRRRQEAERALPLAVDLLAACAMAGRPLDDSMRAVASAVGGPLADILAVHTARLRLGGEPIAEWRALRQHDQLGPLARTVLRSLESGAPIADGLQMLASDTRRMRASDLQRRARAVGVHAAAPLALCFLPAFMLVGIVPTVVGGFQRLVL